MYQLYVDGQPIGEPAHEKTIDRIISRTKLIVDNDLEKRPYVPELKLVVGEVR
jgi:hypothetical protein